MRGDVAGDVFGDLVGDFNIDVASERVAYEAGEVAAFWHALGHGKGESLGRIRQDRALRDEFSDFMAGELPLAAEPLPTPDPRFREILRRRLWRAQVMARLGESVETH